METLGIMLSVPVAAVACTAYCLVLTFGIAGHPRVRLVLFVGGAVVLALAAGELMLLVTMGAVSSRAAIGPAFYPAHLVLFFLGPPALANVLVLRRNRGPAGRWFVAAPLCTAFALYCVLVQYGVAEALYGIDGMSGPYAGQS